MTYWFVIYENGKDTACLRGRDGRDDEPEKVKWEAMKAEQKGGQQTKDLLNEAILHVDVSVEGLVIVDDPPAFDQEPVALRTQR